MDQIPRKFSGVKIVLSVVLCLGVWQLSDAQTITRRPFSDLGRYLKQGDTVFVVTRAQGETRGTLERLSPTSVVLRVDGTEQEFSVDMVGWLERVPDPIWDGLLLGGILYSASFAMGAAWCSEGTGDWFECVITDGEFQLFAGTLAMIPLIVDAIKRERWLVYGTRPRPARTQFRIPRPVASLDELWSRVRPGDTVYVRETGGREIKGEFSRASGMSLIVNVNGQPQDIPADRVQKVWRRTSQVRRGMLLGLVVGGTYGAVNPSEYSSRGDSAGGGAVLGLVLGYTIGLALPGRTMVYGTQTPPAVSVIPVLAPSRSGVVLSLRF